MRPLRRSDGFLDVLRVLMSVGEFSVEDWNARYDWMAKQNDKYFLLIIYNKGRVVGTGSLIEIYSFPGNGRTCGRHRN